MKKFYNYQSDEKENQEERTDSGSEKDNQSERQSETDSESEQDTENDFKHISDNELNGSDLDDASSVENINDKIIDLARGEGNLDSSDSEPENENSLNNDTLAPSFWTVDIDAIPTGVPTTRISIQSLDWDHITAKDLYKLFSAFSSDLEKVEIFLSEFGKARIESENINGPPVEIFNRDLDDTHARKNSSSIVEYDEGKEFNAKQLRAYQLSRLSYYYAIATFKTVEGANLVYENCDGCEFESSANIMDLRYVPVDMEFDEEPVHVATDAGSAGYTPNLFTTDALQHANVTLTWDAEKDQERSKILRKNLTKAEIKELVLDAYIGSSSDESEKDEDIKAKYRQLLVGDEEKDEEEGGMEITFKPGLQEKADALMKEKSENKKKADEGVFEARMRRMAERKEEKKAKRKMKMRGELESSGSDTESSDEDFIGAAESDQETLVVNKKGKDKNTRKEEAKAKAELELLMMPEDAREKVQDHFTIKDVLKSEKLKKKKSFKSKKDKEGLGEAQVGYKMDYDDQRFKAVLSQDAFFIDPTNPKFKKTAAMKELLGRKRSRTQDENVIQESPQSKKEEKKVQSSQSLINAVKRKHQRNPSAAEPFKKKYKKK